MVKKKTDTGGTLDWFKNSGLDLFKVGSIIFFGGVFWTQFNTMQIETERKFTDFKTSSEKRDDRIEKMQEAQGALVNQLTEIKGDMKSQLTEIRGDMKGLSTGVTDIKNSLAQQKR